MYNIILTGIKPNFDLLLQGYGLDYVKQLACENVDLIEQKTYPVVICRYADDVEVEFYKELGEKHGLNIKAIAIPDADNAFKTFDAHVKQNEQEDIHLKSKIEVIELLESGLETLNYKETSYSNFKDAKQEAEDVILTRKENLTAKFKPFSIFMSFLCWMCVCAFIVISKTFQSEDKLFIASLMFCVMMGFSIAYDYYVFIKNKKSHQSREALNNTIANLARINQIKNFAIHEVENMNDSLKARTCLTILPISKRNISNVEEYLNVLSNTNKSIEEVFVLH